ncbi:spermidine/putrescine ABC transporter substrate-binding protein [Asticcacaulis sp.]|uniref:ABC transporter substrate-binding protein n=1 Tax=Asticcacaulis sp. TaxID=1872648 RepID=UPI002C5F5357|nr:spermidine/putrescine ABC transporter substrate-binding protein [Asticcacaulis sp.]HTM82679.1 spermidine/putrescine ABC transporter substrate-binding protein [Asticcacaulis sp.]
MYSRRSVLGSVLAATGAVAAGFSFEGARAAPGKLRFFNWDTYIGAHTLEGFKAATGVEVEMSLFASNDELFAQIAGKGQAYDVIVPSCDVVTRMVERDLLTKLDHARLPNLANMAAPFLDPPYDPKCAYSVPYTWVVQGLGYRRSKMKDYKAPNSWKWVFDSDRYKIAWLSEPSDMIRLGAKYLGFGSEDITPEVVRKVEKLLSKQAKHVSAFHTDNGQDLLKSGEVDIVIEYNGDIAQVMREDPDLDFVVPREGGLRSVDCWAIPKAAPNPDAAYQFLNYMMDAQAGADISETILYPTPNTAARARTHDAYRNNQVIFPPVAVVSGSDFTLWPGAEMQQRFDEAFARIRLAAGR